MSATMSNEKRKKRILVVDDTFPIRDLMRRALTASGYDVEVAQDGADALEIFKQSRAQEQPFSLLILDLAMPDMSGVMLVQKLRELEGGLDVPFVICTAHREGPSLAYAFSMQPVALWDKCDVIGTIPAQVAKVLMKIVAEQAKTEPSKIEPSKGEQGEGNS